MRSRVRRRNRIASLRTDGIRGSASAQAGVGGDSTGENVSVERSATHVGGAMGRACSRSRRRRPYRPGRWESRLRGPPRGGGAILRPRTRRRAGCSPRSSAASDDGSCFPIRTGINVTLYPRVRFASGLGGAEQADRHATRRHARLAGAILTVCAVSSSPHILQSNARTHSRTGRR
jgi:hypothetical protein